MAKKTDAEYHRKTAEQALAFSRLAGKVGAKHVAEINRRDAAEHNAEARKAKQEGR